MKIATWNVNSLKVRLPHLLDWLAEQQPDVLCLQELKQEDQNFPRAEIEAAGYQVAFSGQKTYNGVALLARQPITDVLYGNPHFPDEQKRLITGTVGDTRVATSTITNCAGSMRWPFGSERSLPPTPNSPCVVITTLPRTTATCTIQKPGPAAFFAPNPNVRRFSA